MFQIYILYSYYLFNFDQIHFFYNYFTNKGHSTRFAVQLTSFYAFSSHTHFVVVIIVIVVVSSDLFIRSHTCAATTAKIQSRS